MSADSFPVHSGHSLLAMARSVGAKNVADRHPSASKSAQLHALVSCSDSAAVVKVYATIYRDTSYSRSVRSYTLIIHHGSAAIDDWRSTEMHKQIGVPGNSKNAMPSEVAVCETAFLKGMPCVELPCN